jgi:small redox-active disulfide protein 2
MEIKVLGSGCPNCKRLLANVETAVKEMNLQAEVRYITDYMQIVHAGIMQTPGVIIDGKIASTGRVLSVGEIKSLIEKHAANR